MADIVYLTGAPASGKSTTAKFLSQWDPSIEVFEFGDRLTSHIAATRDGVVQEDLRRESSLVVTPADVQAVECQLFDLAERCRGRSHLIIDSHPVTKERYGFRITPYSLADFSRLAPTQVWVLYATAEATINRIRADPKGRPLVTAEEAVMHTTLQASVAATYAMSIGTTVHMFDTSSAPAAGIAAMLARRLGVN